MSDRRREVPEGPSREPQRLGDILNPALDRLATRTNYFLGRRDRWCGPTAPCRRRLMASDQLQRSTEGLAEDGVITRLARGVSEETEQAKHAEMNLGRKEY